MASLNGNRISDTYTSLLKTADNSAVDTTSKNITDGAGNATALSISTTGVTVSGSLVLSGSLVVANASTLAVTASNAVSASVAVSSSFAATASYLLGSIVSASHAVQADTAITASYITQVGTANTASYVMSSNVVGPYGANTITSASYAITASYISEIGAIAVTGSTIYSPDLGTSNFSTTDGIFIGDSAGIDATTADYSVFIGAFAGRQATTADNAVFIGTSAGDGATDSNAAVFIGDTAGQNASNADHSVFIGLGAGTSALTATQSVFLGESAGSNASNAANTTLIGYQVGALGGGVTGIGANNVIIGTNITLPDDTANTMNLGGVLFVSGTYGDISATNPFSGSVLGARVGIGVSTPAATLDVSGSLRATSGSITFPGLVALNFADDVAAAAGGVPVGGLYRNGNIVSIRVS